MRSLFVTLIRNPLSLLGAAITTIAVTLIAFLFAIELIGFVGNPYIGIIAFLVLPAFFLLGLGLIPIGIVRQRRRERRQAATGIAAPAFPVIDLNRARTRGIVLAFAVLTVLNVLIVATVMWKAVEVMESNEFCGETCHTVMEPEFTAHEVSPHSRVRCVDCHIGPGADWFVKSKLSGAWQVASVTLDLYPRPIPTPVHDLRPARETCEQCHWPEKFVGNRPRLITRHADDEANTPLYTVLMLRVGGTQGDASHGIHWHVDPGNRIRYRSDESREVVHEVELTDSDGSVRRFLAPGVERVGPAPEGPEWRAMDCVDCHNRPAHVYRRPEQEVDAAIVAGGIPRDLPFIRGEAVEALGGEFPSHDAARAEMPGRLLARYREKHPEVATSREAEILAVGGILAQAWSRNVFPKMNVGWGTYPDHIGHEASPGCFRCHNDELADTDGATISQDCELCHDVLAWDEEDPEVLALVR